MEVLIDLFSAENLVGTFIKLFGVVFGFLYLFFTIIMVQQVRSMKSVIKFEDGGTLVAVSIVQVILALLVVGYALFIL